MRSLFEMTAFFSAEFAPDVVGVPLEVVVMTGGLFVVVVVLVPTMANGQNLCMVVLLMNIKNMERKKFTKIEPSMPVRLKNFVLSLASNQETADDDEEQN